MILTKEDAAELKDTLEYILSYIRRPLSNELEVGFRHTPLSNKEIIDRYKEKCEFVVHDVDALMRRIEAWELK